jgi:hypothetical protein
MAGTSPRPYQDDFRKNAKTDNVFRKPKNMVKQSVLEGERKERMKRWITFFRRNPAYLIRDYFGIVLHPYQILIIWVLQRSNLAYIVASRAAAKTWIIAVWSLTLAVLYPGIKITVCAKTLKQGGIILSEKLVQLQNQYTNVAREIDHITYNSNNYEAIFRCGSSIKVVPSSESSRGNRANYIVIEESRLVPKEILESIIKPFLEVRTPPFRLKDEYKYDKSLREEGIISYITSSWYTAEYWYTYVKSCIRRMVSGDETANFLAFDYLISLLHNIKTEEMLKNEMADMDAVTVQMEYLNIPSGSSAKSYFKPTMFPRLIKRAFYTQKEDSFNPKRNPYDIKKTDGELRIVSVDIATRAGKSNDNTIISCARLIPMMGRGYERHLVSMESFRGINTLLQAKRIKEVCTDFDFNFLVLDLQQAGVSVFDALSQVTRSDERGVDLPPYTVAEYDFIEEKLKDELKGRTLGLNALPCVFPILASQSSNSQMASSFRSSLQRKLWQFLLPEGDAENWLAKNNKEFMADANDSTAFSFFMNSYIQTGLFVSECINLDMTLVNGMVKLTEKPGCYKDRFSSVMYMNWIVSQFDKDLLKENDDSLSDWDAILGATIVA